jgi:non-specific serine/threonine protein kinase/serine/threonine-protein kinase
LKSPGQERFDADRWRRAKAIVADAAEASPTERPALVAERCGDDPELRAEVESLLAQTTGRLEQAADHAVQSLRRELSILATGQRIGAWVIVRELGRGGMGAVYLAQRADGAYEKQVAIKVLRRGVDTEEILRRFLAERQILARLDHPGIVRVIDAGTTDDGLPYLAMDYVEGITITQFARERRLSLRQRLELFRIVCAAVSYAHQNLIVHRDLKPSNILVTKEGQVRLLDFGIAKLVEPAAEVPALTITVLRMMTPEYASPEQATGDAITTVSDVYSLGIVLYELLTGERPYHLKRGSPDELSKAIRDQEPQRPSTVITGERERPDDCAELRRQLRGDLDNIVLTALRKEPERRYASVDQFSEDIGRHLEGLPVRARKDTLPYRAGKFVQRHKLPVAAAFLLLFALSGGVIVSTWEARRARRAEAKAENRFHQVRQLAHSVLFDYHDEIAPLAGSTKVRERLVKDALNYLDNLSKEAGDDTGLLRELAEAYRKVASVQGGGTLNNHVLVSFSSLGDTNGALQNELKSVAIWERLARAGQNVGQDLAGAYIDLALYYHFLGDPGKAVEYTSKAIPILDALVAANPEGDTLQLQLVAAYVSMSKALGNPGMANLGDRQGALEWKDKAQRLTETLVAEHPEKLIYQFQLASLYNMDVLMAVTDEEALEPARKAVAIFRSLIKADPSSPFYRRELAIELGNVGSSLLRTGDKTGGLENIKEAQTLFDELTAADPADASIRGSSALNRRKLGSALGANGAHAGAIVNFRQAQATFADLVARDSSNAEFRRQWAYAYLAMSREQLQAGEAQDAAASSLEGVKIEVALVADSPTNANAQNTLALLYAQLGDCEEKIGSKDGWRTAKDAYQHCAAIYEEMKAKGTLAATDAAKLEQVTGEIAKCDVALH